MSDSLIHSFLMSDVSKSLRSLSKNERCELIAQVAHQKWATMSDLLMSLTKNDRPWANRSGCSPKMSKWANRSFFWANCSFAHFFAKNEWFAQKTDEGIPSPANILFPPSRITGLSQQSHNLCWPHESNPGLQFIKLQCYHRAKSAYNLKATICITFFKNPEHLMHVTLVIINI